MLDIWKLADGEFTMEVLSLQQSLTGEGLKAARIKVYRSSECPYPPYELLRIDIFPHVIDRPLGQVTVSSNSRSYALFRSETAQHALPRLIPLPFGSRTLYVINHLFAFRVNRSNVVAYIILFGLICNRIPFYFFDRISLVGSLPIAKDIAAAVPALYRMEDPERIDINYTEETRSIKIEIPCLYEGSLHTTVIKMPDDGFVPEMIESRRLFITNEAPYSEDFQQFDLDNDPTLTSYFSSTPKKIFKTTNLIIQSLILDQLIVITSLPIFIFFCLVIVIYGLSNDVLFSFFDELKASRVISILSLTIGLYTIINIFSRVIYIEIGNNFRDKAATPLGHGLLQLQKSIAQQRQQLGPFLFISITGVEFSFEL